MSTVNGENAGFNICGNSCLPKPNTTAIGILGKLEKIVHEKILQGESALRIALTKDLIPGNDDWYGAAKDALKGEILQWLPRDGQWLRYGECPLYRCLCSVRYAAKLIWFRAAYEAYSGRDHQMVFVSELDNTFDLGPNRQQLRDFALERPFEFDGPNDFRKYVWCLAFADEETGPDSFAARALKTIDSLSEEEANNPETEEYKQLEYGQDVCRHIRELLGRNDAGDFKEFVHVLKQREWIANLPCWLEELYGAARRAIVGIRRRNAAADVRPETLPELELDNNGDVVFVPPDRLTYDENTYANDDRFLFYRAGERSPCAEWRYVDGTFECTHSSVLIRRVGRLEFVRGANTTTGLLKYFLTNEQSGIALFSVDRREGAACGYGLRGHRPRVLSCNDVHSEKLRESEYYKIVWLDSKGKTPIIAFSANSPEGVPLPLTEFGSGNAMTDVFRVPPGTLEVGAGPLRFQIADSRVDLLEHRHGRMLDFVRNRRGGRVGLHYFYNRATYPLSNISGVTGLWYEYDGVRHQLPILGNAADWRAEDDWLWRMDGRLVVKTADRSDRRFRVTFVDVDFRHITEDRFEFGEARKVRVRLGEEEDEVAVTASDAEVTKEYRGVCFSPMVNRVGVQLLLNGKTIAVTRGGEPAVDIAYDDILDGASEIRMSFDDLNDRHFSCCDESFSLAGILGQDQNVVPLSKIFDWRTIRDRLPVTCVVSYPSGEDAYAFRIYDPKSALLVKGPPVDAERRVIVERCEGSNDLHLSYFSSYRHHVTANKIQIAFLLAHRQDESPKYFDLEERMLADDPECRGRCVESVVARGFFSQDIEWGYGVIGFIVERGPYRDDVQTTGFFIQAMHPSAPNLEGNPLKELRAALSERQVRRDVSMTDDDRDRLHRIAAGFMPDDPQRQQALERYINNAANVAASINALGSVNTFCNMVRTSEGKGAWVGGYAFMAGWFVKGFIKNGEFNNWPFPQPYWHPLLVAYKYQTPTQCLPESSIMGMRGFMHESMERAVADNEHDSDVVHILERVRTLVETLQPNNIPHENEELVIPGIPNNAQCIYHMGDFLQTEHSISYYKLVKALNFIGVMLHRWRQNPSLNDPLIEGFSYTLQDLREFLLIADELDDLAGMLIRPLIENKANQKYFKELT